MASFLRQIVAGPRAPHPQANLDLCYVTPSIIATSGPSGTYPQLAYRNPLKDLVRFLDSKHGSQWAIWEFRAEGTGYDDEEVYGRIRHFPWPDHHPPPFGLVPEILKSMREWLSGDEGGTFGSEEKEGEGNGRVAVVHCKAGKGRSGTIACSYLISYENWTPEDAVQRFTERRMRPGFGVGISIPSQRRWIGYVDRWNRGGKVYVEARVEVLEVHVWGLRDGVKIVVEGFVEGGKVIKKFHTFQSCEREVIHKLAERKGTGLTNASSESRDPSIRSHDLNTSTTTATTTSSLNSDILFRPSTPLILPTSNLNIDFERRNKSRYSPLAMVTSVAHVWFNAFFEGHGPEEKGVADTSGVFEMEWEGMDGLKGSSRKGVRAFDKFAVVWRRLPQATEVAAEAKGVAETESAPGEGMNGAADLREKNHLRNLGLREGDVDSKAVSRASSLHSSEQLDGGVSGAGDSAEELAGVRSDVGDADVVKHDSRT